MLYLSCLYRDVVNIKILDDFDIHLCVTVTIFNFQPWSRSSCLVNMITPQFYMDILHIKISKDFDVDLYVTFCDLSN